jgi:hypothetical protein
MVVCLCVHLNDASVKLCSSQKPTDVTVTTIISLQELINITYTLKNLPKSLHKILSFSVYNYCSIRRIFLNIFRLQASFGKSNHFEVTYFAQLENLKTIVFD